MRSIAATRSSVCAVEALTDDDLVHEAPAIVGCRTPSALAHARVLIGLVGTGCITLRAGLSARMERPCR
jgi:hypothetical protein